MSFFVMSTWKIILEYNFQTIELIVNASSFSEAYMEAEKKYPGCKVASVKQIETKKKQ